MSHVTDLRLKLRDLDAAKEAFAACGLDLMEGQKTYATYAGVKNACEHAGRLKDHKHGDFELGLVPAADGDGFDLKGDLWQQSRLMAAVGEGFGKLRQEYAAAVVTRKAPRGFTAKREALANGRLRLRLQKR